MQRIAIFASGSGTNAENIIKYFRNCSSIEVALVLSNKKDAYVLKRAAKHHIPVMIFNRRHFYENNTVLKELKSKNIDLIVLAGFLWLIPPEIIREYRNRIINIHPALLPEYGGKGMYGERVHQAVLENKEKKSGISIHHVNEQYDKGDVIFQASCPVSPHDTIESLQEKIHRLEYKYYPEVIEKILKEKA